MTNILNLIRTPAQASPAQQSAVNGGSAAGLPVNLFAGLVKKLLADIGTREKADGTVEQAAESTPEITKGKPVPGREEDAATVMEEEPRPVKALSMDGAPGAQALILVPQSILMQAAALLPVPAAGMGVGTALQDSGSALGTGDGPGDKGNSAVPSTSGNSLPAVSAGDRGQVNFAQPFNPLDNDGEVLLSLVSEIPPPGVDRSTVTGMPVSGNGSGKSARPASAGIELTAALAGTVGEDAVSPQSVQADIFAVPPPKPDGPAAATIGPPLRVDGKPSIPEIPGIIKPDVNVMPPDQPPAAGGANARLPLGSPQVTIQQQSADVVPAIETAAAAILDPSVVTRPAPAPGKKTAESILRSAASVGDASEISPSGEAPSPAPGVFAGIVRDVFGMLSKSGGQTGNAADDAVKGGAVSPDASADAPLDSFRTGVTGADTAPAVADVQSQPGKKNSPVSGGDAGPVTGADAARPAREQVDLSALRSLQTAAGGAITSDKPEPVTTAVPLRDLPSPYAPLPAEVSRRIADQVVQNLKLEVDGTTSDIRMTLKPPSLGEVQLTIHVEDARMQAQIDVSQQVVKAALEAHMPQLRQALQEHGIEVQRIDVMLPESSLQRDGSGTNGERAGRRGTRRMLSGDDPESYQGAKDMGYNTIELIM